MRITVKWDSFQIGTLDSESYLGNLMPRSLHIQCKTTWWESLKAIGFSLKEGAENNLGIMVISYLEK